MPKSTRTIPKAPAGGVFTAFPCATVIARSTATWRTRTGTTTVIASIETPGVIERILELFVSADGDAETSLDKVPACQRMHLAAQDMITVPGEFEDRITALRELLGK